LNYFTPKYIMRSSLRFTLEKSLNKQWLAKRSTRPALAHVSSNRFLEFFFFRKGTRQIHN
jgi:hypothetical protein